MHKDFPFNQNIKLENNRALLRPLAITDHSDLLKITLNKPELLQYSPSQNHTFEKMEAYMTKLLKGKQAENHYPFVVIDKPTYTIAGTTSFGNISSLNLRLEIGWTWLDPKFHGTGLNQNMKFLMLEYAFETLHYQRVEFKADALNTQSRKAMEKIGAQYEGTLRNHTTMSEDRRRDTVYYSILSKEWKEVKINLKKKL